ncbi:MAG: hypothetical protein M1819_002676 [Sarea resinae]|nr:MAG: hypothetical protein M1819_002676 [Sarea resinae]
MSSRIGFTVHGQVIGVNFRSFTTRKAKELGVTGWVQNTDDGKVAGQAQGDETALDSFVKAINNGPPAAHVVKVEKEEQDVVSGESSFVTK